MNSRVFQSEVEGDLISLSDLISTLLKEKFIIGIIAVSTAAIVLAIVWMISSFTSSAYLQMGMSLAEFKRVQAVIGDPVRWEKFRKHHAAALGDIEGIRLPASQKAMSKIFEPVYAYTKAESKNLPESVLKSETDYITGINVSYSDKDPLLARRGVSVMSEFWRDIAILGAYEEEIQSTYTKYSINQRNIRNRILATNHELNQLKKKKLDMMQIAAAYPGDKGANIRQVISIADGSEKFLAPTTQLIAIEAGIVEKNQLLVELVRQQEMNDAWLSYSAKSMALLQKSDSGVAFLNELQKLKNALGLDLGNSALESVFNEISQQNISAASKYLDQARLLTGASVAVRKPGLSFTVIAGLLLGLLLGVAYAFWLNRERWSQAGSTIPSNNLMLQQA